MSECEYPSAVVIDCGSDTCKLGIAGQDNPTAVFPSIVGRRKNEIGLNVPTCYVGKEALERRPHLQIKHPIETRIITDWEGMEEILRHAFSKELTLAIEDHPVLMTEAPLNPKSHREKTTELLFEKFHVPAMYLSIQSVLALYASGRTTGFVVDSGHGATHMVPVYEGYPLPHAILHTFVGGNDLTDVLMRLLSGRGYRFTTSHERDSVRRLKETQCYLALDYEQERSVATSSTSLDKEYTLPDGETITVREERFACPEAIIQPSFLGFESLSGFHKMLYDSISKCDVELRPDLCRDIVLTGGNTLFPGFPERLKKELDEDISFASKRATERGTGSKPISTKFIAPENRLYTVWEGGSTLAALSTFQTMWVTKQQYEEMGPTIVHKKCI